MNEVIRQLAARKSVRAFEDRDIPGEVRAAILEAAAQAPTAGNQQLYTILDVTDPQLKARLAETCDHQPFIAQAPMVLIFLADVCKWLDAYREAGCEPRAPGAGDVMLAASDAAIAAQNAVTAAWSLGVGSCYIGDVMERCEEHREMLNLPPHVFPRRCWCWAIPRSSRRAGPSRSASTWRTSCAKTSTAARTGRRCGRCSPGGAARGGMTRGWTRFAGGNTTAIFRGR